MRDAQLKYRILMFISVAVAVYKKMKADLNYCNLNLFHARK